MSQKNLTIEITMIVTARIFLLAIFYFITQDKECSNSNLAIGQREVNANHRKIMINLPVKHALRLTMIAIFFEHVFMFIYFITVKHSIHEI